ncbi:Syntaxin-18 [Balamuthia mandrillaris]
MDLTSQFRDCVRRRHKAKGLLTPLDKILGEQKGARGAPRRRRSESNNTEKAADCSKFLERALLLLQGIAEVRQYLVDHEAEYLNTHRWLSFKASGMTEEERDEIDKEMKLCLRQSCDKIDGLSSTIESKTAELPRQCQENLRGVVSYLYKELEGVSKLHGEQRALRLQRLLDSQHNYYKQSSEVLAAKERSALARKEVTGPFSSSRNHRRGRNEDENDEGRSEIRRGKRKVEDEDDGPMLRGLDAVAQEHEDAKGKKRDEEQEEEDEFAGLSEAERQMLQQENQELQQRFERDMDKAMEVEKQMLEIARLSDLFTQRVMEQEETITTIQNMALDSYNHLTQGTDYMRSASKHGRDFRFFVLLFLLLCSFSLLFLHWYDS